MREVIQQYLLTSIAAIAIGLSLAIFALGAAGIIPIDLWRVLIVPAYVPMLIASLIATALALPGTPVLWLVGFALVMLPFVAADWLLARARRPNPPAA